MSSIFRTSPKSGGWTHAFLCLLGSLVITATAAASNPTIVSVMTIPDDLPLDICTIPTQVWEIDVRFSEPMYDPPGHTDPADVSNPSNYRLLGAGPDGVFSTATCGVVTGDDVLIEWDGINYNAALETTTLTLAGEGLIRYSAYRAAACASLTDNIGNPLDGNADGNGGDHAQEVFRFGRSLADNGDFDCGGSDWSAQTSGSSVDLISDDVDDAPHSGAVRFTSATGGTSSLAQCVQLNDFTGVVLQASTRSAGAGLDLTATCSFYESNDCSGPAQVTRVEQASPGYDDWSSFTVRLGNGEEVASAMCSIDVSGPGAFAVDIDAVKIEHAVFDHGFENDDIGSWQFRNEEEASSPAP